MRAILPIGPISSTWTKHWSILSGRQKLLKPWLHSIWALYSPDDCSLYTSGLMPLSNVTYNRLHNIEIVCWFGKTTPSFDVIIYKQLMLNLCHYENRAKWLLIKIKHALISLKVWSSFKFRFRMYIYAMNGCVSHDMDVHIMSRWIYT